MLALLRDRPLESLQCPNSKCPSHKRDAPSKGLSIRYFRGNGMIRYLHCHDCGLEFSERQGTPLFGLRISEQKAFDILNHTVEGCGVRGTSRLCGVQEETVIRLQLRCSQHFKMWHDNRVQQVKVHEAQLDEKWSFVGKKTEELRRQKSR
jgi:transposase-like protein